MNYFYKSVALVALASIIVTANAKLYFIEKDKYYIKLDTHALLNVEKLNFKSTDKEFKDFILREKFKYSSYFLRLSPSVQYPSFEIGMHLGYSKKNYEVFEDMIAKYDYSGFTDLAVFAKSAKFGEITLGRFEYNRDRFNIFFRKAIKFKPNDTKTFLGYFKYDFSYGDGELRLGYETSKAKIAQLSTGYASPNNLVNFTLTTSWITLKHDFTNDLLVVDDTYYMSGKASALQIYTNLQFNVNRLTSKLEFDYLSLRNTPYEFIYGLYRDHSMITSDPDHEGNVYLNLDSYTYNVAFTTSYEFNKYFIPEIKLVKNQVNSYNRSFNANYLVKTSYVELGVKSYFLNSYKDLANSYVYASVFAGNRKADDVTVFGDRYTNDNSVKGFNLKLALKY
ncbi:hypothetical protein [Psittacicella hinzii]|uniref:Uncharacterized protein n=1 Tax=Psittacicella hinzii TaxID=2028575 RepID=A0A3A1YJL6_9GAMM|nr:hypothetical protein [Psittacicella hinzii]RIY36217.1 hypothetical protein CKF58_06140 [Psittacicella hinzii]